MRRSQAYLPWSVLLASLGAVQAKLDLNSDSNIVVYWGQNSLQGNGGEVQQSLAHYCENDNIDVIPMAFDMMVNGPGGVPQVDFSVTSKDCDVFPGTQLKNCPKIGQDIQTCQDKGKTILLSIGGATYSEGGFKSESDAKAGAKLIWETFGPQQDGSKALRPFGNASLDGFDFDFEAAVTNMAPFANELRSLMDKEKSKQYFLTAAPQCPYPDAADKDILNGPVSIDAVWVQFYNNYCGVNNFDTDSEKSKYNFEEWDYWARTVSQNKNVKVMLGVPADTTAASSGYVPVSKLADVIEYSKKFKSFGGVMMWDTTQAYANQGFIEGVRKALSASGPNSGSSSSSNPASTTTSAPTSTNSPNTSQSSNAPGSLSSSSSSSGSGSSPSGHDQPEPTTASTTSATEPTANSKPTESATKPESQTNTAEPADKPTATTKPDSAPKPTTTEPAPKPTADKPTTTEPAPKPTADKPTTTKPAPKPTTTTKPSVVDPDDLADLDLDPFNQSGDNDDDDDDNDDSNSNSKNEPAKSKLLSSDLFGLLKGLKQANGVVKGLKQANGVVKGLTQALTKNLRHAKRIGYN